MNFIGFGAMAATKPYEFIGFGAMAATKPYECMSLRRPSEFVKAKRRARASVATFGSSRRVSAAETPHVPKP